jgi:DNA-binding CsgD family transcriptional regulator
VTRPTVVPELSRRQREVLVLLSEGVGAQQIAVRLGLSEATVRNHIRGILRKLDCHSQLQAVARARELGLLG